MSDRENLVAELEDRLYALTATPSQPAMGLALASAMKLLADLGYDFTKSRLRAPAEPKNRSQKRPPEQVP